MLAVVKFLSALLGLLDFITGQIERAQIRSAAKAEVERDVLSEIVKASYRAKALESRLRSNTDLLDKLRNRYRNRK